MKQYKVNQTCWGFMGRRWDEGKTYDLPDDAVPPRYFEFIGNKENPLVIPEVPKIQDIQKSKDVMAPIVPDKKNPIKVRGGFASKVETIAPKEVLTASQAYKKRGRPSK